jgi:DNA helicase-2/ATP-dependent DNA helicase PcrA
MENNIYRAGKMKEMFLKKQGTDGEHYEKEMKTIHNEQQNRIKEMKKNFAKKIYSYLKEPKKSILKHYEQFLMNEKLMSQLLEGEDNQSDYRTYFKEIAQEIVAQKKVEIEDLPALMYLKHKLQGIESVGKIKHIVIDEGQDFGAFQFYVLRIIMKEATFTILGDIAQGINHHRGTSQWQGVQQQVFDAQCQIKYLKQSYRTTVEIMNAANIVIGKVEDKNIVPAQPVIRHGSQVKKIKNNSKKEIIDHLYSGINSLKEQYSSIAIICKNSNQCEEIFQQLTLKGLVIQWLKDNESQYNQQVVLLPAYLAKGLEFDCVFIPDGGVDDYKVEPLDAMLLYVCMTRALHELSIYYIEACSRLLV